ncbi:acyl-CoA N-acyltransferase [Hyaloraphidium curvatum]|nr:acyl-CoA N-acyltransferase [Hyaloraphidium curvatum]
MAADNARFAAYLRSAHRAPCLALFDANCPAFFAPEERPDYETFLDDPDTESSYAVLLEDGGVVAAVGVSDVEGNPGCKSLDWLLVDPRRQGKGIGRTMMREAVRRAAGAEVLEIGGSHLVEAFYAKSGAVRVGYVENGWGPGMHRVDMEIRLGEQRRDGLPPR